jgi:hypothetical protein
MTREELIELAALDAFGLLDDYEAALYTRSFHHAPAAVQDEIIRLQAEIAVSDVLEGPEEPDASLRGKVLSSVAVAIERESSGLGPLASIGRARAIEPRAGIGRIGIGRSAQFWRAAAFVMMGAAVVVAYFWTEAQRNTNEIALVALGIDAEKDIHELVGAGLEEFALNPNSKSVFLTPVAAGDGSFAVIYVNTQTKEAFVAAIGLSTPAGTHSLEVQQSDGSFVALGKLKHRPFCSVLRLNESLTSSLLTATVRITADGRTVLSSA